MRRNHLPACGRRWVLAAVSIALGLSVAVLAALSLPAAAAPAAAPAVTLSDIGVNVSDPTAIAHAGDGTGRLFLIERAGRVLIYQNGAALGTPFLNISARVLSDSSERGLLGIAFPPGFAASQRFYVYYTNLNGDINVSRFSVSGSPNLANAASETRIITVPHPTYANHNGGQLQFGPDGFLYVGTGDGGSGGDPSNNAQTTSVLLGKLLRIDPEGAYPSVPTYTVPASNPFTQTAGYRPEIWALGLRNPWRFSFDRGTGDLYIGDVGQGTWEEVDYQTAGSAGGQNYGWRCFEGRATYDTSLCNLSLTYTAPITVYAHGTECSITGGYVYRGGQYAALAGRYIYGDFCSGKIWALTHSAPLWSSQLLTDTAYMISTFGEDEQGNLYVAAWNTGRIYRIGSMEFGAYLPLIRR